jgi:sortase (surface protein transpeptidase)
MRGSVAAGVFVVAVLSGASALAAPSGWLAIDGSIRSGGGVDWANSGLGSTLVIPCPAGTVVSVSGTGGLFNGGRCAAADTPPIAPTVINDPSIVSSSFVVDPLSTDNVPCAAGDPTTISGKNGDPITSYAITAGGVPDKTELSNVYAVTHTRTDNGHPEIYFAAERLVNNGESHLDFEFLQSTVTMPGGCGLRAMTGTRTEGDLLVAVDFTMGGALAGRSVYVWHCVPPGGVVCSYEPAVTDPVLLSAVTVTVNAAGDIPCGGWVCRDKVGAPIAMVPQNDFLEGGIDLNTLGFTGCFHTFLPHTRASQSFDALLEDFAGPIAFSTCRDPVTNSSPAGTVGPGTSVRDTIDLTDDGAAIKPTGIVTFFLCSPAQVTGLGCSSGTQVGAPKAVIGGLATSDPSTATNAAGKYCWRTVYTPDASSLGIYEPGSHTNATTECFNVVVAASLPDTGFPDPAGQPGRGFPPEALLVPGALMAVLWRRSRSVAVLLMAGVIVGSSPPIAPAPVPTGRDPGVAQSSAHVDEGATPTQIGGVKAKAMGWRLVIPRIGVDALIQSVGRDSHGAMASPSGLDTVAWFNRGPLPGHPGDAVIDGHYGDSNQAGVFRKLHWLRPGDEIQVVWPDGRTVFFEVATSEVVAANAHPAGVFASTGPARISLITCTGLWDKSRGTYSDRLIVTAMLS